MAKGKVMLSINDHPDIRELFKGFRITELNLAYSISREKDTKKQVENWLSVIGKKRRRRRLIKNPALRSAGFEIAFTL